ncbi:DoxX family protein [Pedobacter sp.]|uniref:DoxX family protein n=1 Tax=Pedobacter sp. TaxID=1411316 RepID=UPI00396CF762
MFSRANTTIWLRIAVSIVFFMHSVPGMFNGGITEFGKNYLDTIGFAPIGLFMAWAIKLTHVFGIFSLLLNKWLWVSIPLNIIILIAGIGMVHLQNGWYVVGGGSNGIEFNVLLIAVLVQILWNTPKAKPLQ